MLQAVAIAASATALGQDDINAQRGLDGKRFDVRIRFGCTTVVAAPFNVRFGEEDRTLRVRAAPDMTLKDPAVAPLSSQSIEAVEGFWLRKPWLLQDGCPVMSNPQRTTETKPAVSQTPRVVTGNAARPAVYSQRVGIAQFFTEADSRTSRREARPYDLSKVLAENEAPSPVGYNLVLSGRLRRLPDGRVISCRVADVDAPPECVVSAEFDRVRIENPGTRNILGEWGS